MNVLSPSQPYFLCQEACKTRTTAFAPQSEVMIKMQMGKSNIGTITKGLVQKQHDGEGRSESGDGWGPGREFWDLEVRGGGGNRDSVRETKKRARTGEKFHSFAEGSP